MTVAVRKQSFIGAALGTVVEYYDTALLAIFLPLIAPQFFPGKDAYHSLMQGYYLLALTMLMRPIGGALFGHIGDMFGRPRALLLSMYGIAVTTFAIGLTPTYASIGVAAIVIILLCKSLQIACFGGEYNGAGIYVVEHAKAGREGLASGLLTGLMVLGSFAATLLGVLLTVDGMPDWSWRIAFFIGGIIGVIGVMYRKNLHESPHFKPADKSKDTLKKLIKDHPRQLIAGVFIGGFATVPFTTIISFIVPVLMTKGFMTSHQMMWIQSLLILCGFFVLILSGHLADRYSPQKIMRFGAVSLIAFSIPLLMLTEMQSLFWLILGSIGIVSINQIVLGPANVYMKKSFPSQFRYRGSSIGFTLGLSVLGSLTPIVENALYALTGSFVSAAIWLIALGFGTFWCITAKRYNYADQRWGRAS